MANEPKPKLTIEELRRRDAELSEQESDEAKWGHLRTKRALLLRQKMDAGLSKEHAEQAIRFQELTDIEEEKNSGQSVDQRRAAYEAMKEISEASR